MSSIAPGSKLSHFEILEKLGEGGMGVVYKARDLRLDRFVAIKVLPEKALAHAGRQARFVQEAKAASALNHPNIITIHEIDTVDGATFIAMEYVDGRTLDQIITRKGVRFPEALKYAVQITDALAAAHRIGIVHRDIKPANIMVGRNGAVKVLDFGLAKLTQPAEATESEATASIHHPLSEEGSVVGTVAYMSPEQAEAKEIDGRSDIFSFGIVLYETLTGRRPFMGPTNLSTLSAIVNQEPTPASQVVEDLPHDLERILSRCLRKDPARRFQGMSDLHVALEELKDESDSGRLTAPAGLKRTPKRAWLWASVALIVALATAGVFFARKFATPMLPQRVVSLTTYPGSEEQPCFSPDGNQVAFSWDGDKGDNVDIYVKLLGEANSLRLTTNPAADLYPAWSPDGKHIALERLAAGKAMGVYTVSPLGGAEQKLSDFPGDSAMSWSPDGKWLAASANAPNLRGIFLLPIEGGEPRRITDPKLPAFHKAPSISPNGRRLAYAGCGGIYACDVYIQELDSAYVPQGAPRRITQQGMSITGISWTRDGASVVYNGSITSGILHYLWRVGVDDRRSPERLDIAGLNSYSPSIAPIGNHLVFSKRVRDYDIWQYRVGGTIEPLIASSLAEFNPQFSPDGSKIAFESSRSGEAEEVWVTQADGSNPTQMTNRFGRHQGSPRWSPDGRWIALDSQGQDGHWHLFTMESTGGRPRRITSEFSNENMPSWSRDGKWIYFSSDQTGRSELWRIPFSGGPAQQITRNGAFTAFESADGKSVFYTKDESSPLFSQPLSGGSETEVLPYVENRAFVPVDNGIYYIGRLGADNYYPLQFLEFSSHTSRLLTKIPQRIYYGMTLSPDRKTILFTKTVAYGADLMMIENFR